MVSQESVVTEYTPDLISQRKLRNARLEWENAIML